MPPIYSTSNPKISGVYACRIPNPDYVWLADDVFLQWYDHHWWYLSSDQKYRGEVLGWIGPLPRTKR